MNPDATRKQRALQLLVLGVVAAVYARALAGGLVWDDHVVLEPAGLRHPLRLFFTSYLSNPDAFVSPYYRPLTSFSYALEQLLYGQNPLMHHAVNVGLHLACTALVMSVAGRLWPSRSRLAPIAGLLFGLHPVHVEPVAWIAGRPDLLTALASLAAFRVLLGRQKWPGEAGEAAAAPGSTDTSGTASDGTSLAAAPGEVASRDADGSSLESVSPSPARIALAACLLVAGLLAKESAAALPVALVLMWPARRWRSLALILTPMALGMAAWFWMRHQALETSSRALITLHGQSAGAGLATAARILQTYLVRLVLPAPLCAEWEIDRAVSLFDPAVAVAALLVGGWAVLRRRSSGPESLGWAWFLAFLLPVANLIPLDETVAERYLYLPSVGLAWAAAGLAARALAARRPIRLATPGLLALVSLSWSLKTLAGIGDWHTERELFEHQVVCAPNSARAHINLAQVRRKEGRTDATRLELEQALRLAPADTNALNLMADVSLEQHHPEEALPLVQKALAGNPGHVAGQLLLGRVYLALERPDEALEAMQKAAALAPDRPEALRSLGIVAFRARRTDLMRDAFERLVRLETPDAPTLNYLGIARTVSGDLPGGVAAFRGAIAVSPENTQAHCNLARALEKLGQTAEAQVELRVCQAGRPATE